MFLLNCSLSTLPLLTHRLNFETQFDYDGIALLLRTSAPLRVLHGPFASAEIAVEPVRARSRCMRGLLALAVELAFMRPLWIDFLRGVDRLRLSKTLRGCF